MKILWLPFLILCIYLSQICSSIELSDEDINNEVKRLRDSIYGVSDQFVDDVKAILDKFRNYSMIIEWLPESLYKMGKMSKEVLGKENVKIDEKMLRDFYSTNSYIRSASAFAIAMKMDFVKIIQSILSKQLPPERYQGIMNIIYIRLNKNATTEEIQSTLDYLYGTDAAAAKTSFFNKIPDLNATDCPRELPYYKVPDAENTLKSMNDIKPKVIQDFVAIRDNFPCTYDVFKYLRTFVDVLKRSQGDDLKIDACKIKAKPGNWEDFWTSYHNTREYMERQLQELESVLSTRLTDQTYGGLINFLRVTIPDTPIDEIENALEYLYDDVPKANCPEKERAKLETE